MSNTKQLQFFKYKNSSALHNLNLNENKMKVSKKVQSEMSRLRTQASLVPLAVLTNGARFMKLD